MPAMSAHSKFTARQGEMLAFICRFTATRGMAPSFEEIASHFGTSSPSVSGMIKALERRGLLSREPGVARSLRVLVPASFLPHSEFGSRPGGRRKGPLRGVAAPTAADAAFAAAVSVIDVFEHSIGDADRASDLVERAASAVYDSLSGIGMPGAWAGRRSGCRSSD